MAAGAFGLTPPGRDRCQGPEQVIVQGEKDNFQGGKKAATPSAELLRSPVGSSTYGKYRGYDEPGEDKLFATSIPIPKRNVCSVRVEVRLRRKLSGGLSFEFNDFIQLGFAPLAPVGVRRSLLRGGVWIGEAPSVQVKSLQLTLPAPDVNRYLEQTKGPYLLDVLVHDDTEVDYVTLVLRFN